MTTLVTSDAPRPTPPGRTAFLLGLLFGIDAFIVGQGFLSLLVAVAGTAVLLLAAGVAAMRKRPLFVRNRLVRAGLYVALGVVTIGVLRLHHATSRRGADRIIEACHAYRTATGHYPQGLDELVPRFLPAIPISRYTLSLNSYQYVVSGTREEPYHTLVYVAIPPFGRRTYSFEHDRWGNLD